MFYFILQNHISMTKVKVQTKIETEKYKKDTKNKTDLIP